MGPMTGGISFGRAVEVGDSNGWREPTSSLGGYGFLRPGFAALEFPEKQSFHAPAAPELLSLCVAKEKDNQRERPPRLALAGHPARQVREPGPGFSNG
ncbi:MAG TPA: hypothetical protein VIL60_03195, partial [Rhodanobacter sp.]